MADFRAFLRTHRRLAAALLALALCMKVLVPAGFMVGQNSTVLTIEICADASGGHVTTQIVVPHAGKHGETQGEAGKSSAACPYAGLSMAGLSGADPVLLALALTFILAIGFAPIRIAPPRRILHIRPPLRGPPTLA